MKKIISLILFLIVFLSITAAPRSVKQAQTCAERFFHHQNELSGIRRVSAAQVPVDLVAELPKEGSEAPALYIFNHQENQGFVIISADDNAPEIVGYSDTGSFDVDNIPAPLRSWLSMYQQQISELANKPSSQVKKRMRTSVSDEVKPLLGNIQWGQNEPYNRYCKGMFSQNQAYSGCVATATAQVMKYYSYPDVFQFNSHYSEYNWSNMLPKYDGVNSTDEQDEEVAVLLRDIGRAYGIIYTQIGSLGLVIFSHAVLTCFGYDKNAHVHNRALWQLCHPFSSWEELMRNELRAGRPILYSGQQASTIIIGHCFVCDGFDKNGLFHINWGWDGHYDGYFSLGLLDYLTLNGGQGSRSSNFTLLQSAVIGIKPNQTKPYQLSGDVCYSRVSGSLDKKDHSLSFSAYDLSPNDNKEVAKGNLAIVLTDQENKVAQVINPCPINLKKNTYYPRFPFSGTLSIRDGEYIVHLAYQPEGDSRWFDIPCHCGFPFQYKLTKSQSGYSLEEYANTRFTPYIYSSSMPARLVDNVEGTLQLHISQNESTCEFRDSINIWAINRRTKEEYHLYCNPSFYISPHDSVMRDLSIPVSLPGGEYGLFMDFRGAEKNLSTMPNLFIQDKDIYWPYNLKSLVLSTLGTSNVSLSWDGIASKYRLEVYKDSTNELVYCDTISKSSRNLASISLPKGKYKWWVYGLEFFKEGKPQLEYRSEEMQFEVKAKTFTAGFSNVVLLAQYQENGEWYYMSNQEVVNSSNTYLKAINTHLTDLSEITTLDISSDNLWSARGTVMSRMLTPIVVPFDSSIQKVKFAYLIKNKDLNLAHSANFSTILSLEGTAVDLTNKNGYSLIYHENEETTYYLQLSEVNQQMVFGFFPEDKISINSKLYRVAQSVGDRTENDIDLITTNVMDNETSVSSVSHKKYLQKGHIRIERDGVLYDIFGHRQ